VTLRFETVFVIGTFSGSGSDHRRHHRSPVTANRPTGQVYLKARYALGTPTVTLRSTSIASGFSAIVLRVAGLRIRRFEPPLHPPARCGTRHRAGAHQWTVSAVHPSQVRLRSPPIDTWARCRPVPPLTSLGAFPLPRHRTVEDPAMANPAPLMGRLRAPPSLPGQGLASEPRGRLPLAAPIYPKGSHCRPVPRNKLKS